MNGEGCPLPRASHIQHARCNGQCVQAVGIDHTFIGKIGGAVIERSN